MKTRCRFDWHRWSDWESPREAVLTDGDVIWAQQRICFDCRLTEVRRVPFR